ncbi:MAG: lactoylglutathione lyase, partial [Solirubrobacterales bacterium]|nr:lactoylglutathione lyase [Solirubrobacterales bacterium]
YLHTMLRVRDLDKSLDFYTNHLGMTLLRKNDFPGGKFTLAFVGYGDESSNTVLELTHNWDQEEPYEIGTGYGHIAFVVDDLDTTLDDLAVQGISPEKPPYTVSEGGSRLCFVRDPDGYRIELIEGDPGRAD